MVISLFDIILISKLVQGTTYNESLHSVFRAALPDSTSRSSYETLDMHIGTVIMDFNIK